MILDTNALSAHADGEAAIANFVLDTAGIEIPVIVLGEYRYGVAHSRRRKEHEEWIAAFVSSCRVLDVTDETSRFYAGIRSELRIAGTPIPDNDAWIAALSRQHGLPLLSRDSHFDRVSGLRRIGW